MQIFRVIFFIAYIFVVIFVAGLGAELYVRITTYKISDFLILNRKKIQQYISFKSALKQSISLNYYDNKVQNVNEIINDSFEQMRKFIYETNMSKLYTSTNPIMERKLKKLEKENLIIIKKISIEPKYKRQILERLILMGLRTSLYNLFNTKYWKYIFKKVEVNKFEITIKNNIKNMV